MSLHENEATQFALQIQTNTGSPSAYWSFDEDFGALRDDPSDAWDDLAQAQGIGYRRSDLRVVAITTLPEPGVEGR